MYGVTPNTREKLFPGKCASPVERKGETAVRYGEEEGEKKGGEKKGMEGGEREEGRERERGGRGGLGGRFHSRNGLLFSGLGLWSSSVEHLQQCSSSGTHTRVKICL